MSTASSKSLNGPTYLIRMMRIDYRRHPARTIRIGHRRHPVGAIVGNYKSVSTRQINRLRRSPGTPIWQRNYHDRILRTAQELHNVRAYIQTNPQNWDRDRLRIPRQQDVRE